MSQGVFVGGCSLNADIRRDAGQHLVACNQHTGFFAVQTGMLRRMAMTDNDAPVTPANGEPTLVKQSMMRARQFGYAMAIGVAAGFQCLKTLFSQTVTAEIIH